MHVRGVVAIALALVGSAFAGLDAVLESQRVSGAKVIGAQKVLAEAGFANKDFTLQYTFFNIGDQDATDVELSGLEFVDTLKHKVIAGDFKAEFPIIPAGSNVTHLVVFQVSTPGTTFNITAVPFTYKNGDKTVHALTSHAGQVTFYEEKYYKEFFTTHSFEWTVYMFIMGSLIFLPFMRYNSSASQFYGIKPRNTLAGTRSKKIQ